MKSQAFVVALATLVACHAFAEEDFNRPALGVSVTSIPEEPPQSAGLMKVRWPTKRGVLVLDVAAKSPAAEAGIESMTIIESINDKTVTTLEEFRDAIKPHKPGDLLDVRFRTMSVSGKRVRYRRGFEKIKVITLRDYLRLRMEKFGDELSETVFYRHADQPKGNMRTGFDLAIARSDGKYVPILQFHWNGEDWLFVRAFTVVVDGKKFKIDPNDLAFSRDNSAGKVWEWINVPATTEVAKKLVADLEKAESVQVYFHGDTYRDDHKLDNAEIARLNESVAFFNSHSKSSE